MVPVNWLEVAPRGQTTTYARGISIRAFELQNRPEVVRQSCETNPTISITQEAESCQGFSSIHTGRRGHRALRGADPICRCKLDSGGPNRIGTGGRLCTRAQLYLQRIGTVFGETASAERDEVLDSFRSGELKYLVNVNVLTTGFDAPNIDCVAMVRPTLSPGLYYQMVGRGFRLFDGKENCLVLDFGGNVLRHGPVDAIRIHRMNHRGNGDAPAKQCPECQSLVAAGYAVCPDCGYEFPPPKRQNHGATASTEDILSGEVTTTGYEVEGVHYSVHHKRGAPDDAPKTLRVEYRIGFHKYQSEWICFEHTGWPRHKAESWWRRRSNAPVPVSAAEAVALADDGALCETRSITVRTVAGEEYPRIIGYDLGAKPPWREPGLDDDVGDEVYAYADEGDLPF